MTEKINWKYVIGFYVLAVILAYPFNAFLTKEIHQKLTEGTIFYKSSFLPAGLVTLFVGLLALYHLQCHAYFKQQKAGVFKTSSFKLRLFNELATVFLVAIVFLIIVRSTGGLVWGMLGLFIFAALLMGGVYIYKKQRKAMEEKDNTPPTIPNN